MVATVATSGTSHRFEVASSQESSVAVGGVAAQAMMKARASLEQSWGSDPILDPSACERGPAGCSPVLPATSLSSAGPAPWAGTRPTTPPPVAGAALVYDSNQYDGYILMFGGVDQNGVVSRQTWIYQAGNWANYTPPNPRTGPLPRWGAMITYYPYPDGPDGYVVMFSGCALPPHEGLCPRSLGDTWKFAFGSWVLIMPPAPPNPPPFLTNLPPPSRWDGAMTYDEARQSVVLYGGAGGLLDVPPSPGNPTPTAQMFGDTWEYSESSGQKTWTQLSASGPPSGYGSRLVYDPQSALALLVGGTDFTRYDDRSSPQGLLGVIVSGRATNQTWEFSALGSWSLYAPPSGGRTPPARWDANLGKLPGGPIILEGGTNTSGAVYTDFWEFINQAAGWIELLNGSQPTQPNDPIPRWGSGFAFDTFDAYFVMTGGWTPSGSVIGDVYAFAAPAGWAQLTRGPTFPTAPGSRYQEAIAFDDALSATVMFGGERCGTKSCTFLGDTWTFSSGVWHPLSLSNAPSPRFGAAITYDPWSRSIILFGGCGAVCPLSDTWQLTKAARAGTPTWTQLYPTVSPPGRYFATLSFDAQDDWLVLFGGCEGALGPCPTGDTWFFAQGSWNLVLPARGVSPPARFGASAAPIARDPTIRPGAVPPTAGLLLFGGQGTNGMLSDTWNFTSGFWTETVANLTPPSRVFASLMLDPLDHSLVLFGGCEIRQCPALDPWQFSLLPRPVMPPPGPGPPPPPPRPWPWAPVLRLTLSLPTALYGSSAVLDPIDGSVGYVLYFGGRIGTGATLGATGAFIGGNWFDMSPYV